MPGRKERIKMWLGLSRELLLGAVAQAGDANWGQVAHADAGWTARDLLAHVTGAEPSMGAETRLRMASSCCGVAGAKCWFGSRPVAQSNPRATMSSHTGSTMVSL